MEVLVLGGAGMLGHKVFQHLDDQIPDSWCTIRGRLSDPSIRGIQLLSNKRVIENIDAMNIAQLTAFLHETRPKTIVNCIGVIKQRDEAKCPVPSITINALLPHVLAAECAKWNGRLIHFSTDCVFSGSRGGYTEEDSPDALDLYGRSKALGEVGAQNALTLRTSIIGRELNHRTSLLEWLIAQNGSTIRGFVRAMYSGVTTLYLAEIICRLIKQYPTLSGIFQVTSGTISKYELLRLLRDAYKLDVTIVPNSEFFCNRSMCGDLFTRTTGYAAPDWPTLATQLAADPTPYSDWRESK